MPDRIAPTTDAADLRAIVGRYDSQRADAMREVLEELRDWFADKADVKDGEFGPIPDAYMRWEIRIRQALGEQI